MNEDYMTHCLGGGGSSQSHSPPQTQFHVITFKAESRQRKRHGAVNKMGFYINDISLISNISQSIYIQRIVQ